MTCRAMTFPAHSRVPGTAHRRCRSSSCTTGPGDGPDLHQHPYDETFVILEGHVVVRVGGESIEGGPGDIVIGPAATPHGFTNPGPGPAQLVCIHAAPAMTTEWLD